MTTATAASRWWPNDMKLRVARYGMTRLHGRVDDIEQARKVNFVLWGTWGPSSEVEDRALL